MARFFGSYRPGSKLELYADYPNKQSRRSLNFIDADANITAHIFGDLFLPSGELLTQKNFNTELSQRCANNLDAVLHDCNGAFVGVIVDENTNTIQLFCDAFGNYALHYSIYGDSIHFSTSAVQLATILNRSVNEEALFELFAIGQTLCSKTLYNQVHRVPVGSILSFNDAGLRQTNYFSTTTTKALKADVPDILDQITEQFLLNVDRHSRLENIEVTLSGGFDSRTTLAALLCLGRANLPFYTHGKADSWDMRIASRLATDFGLKHRTLFFDNTYFKGAKKLHQNIINETETAFVSNTALPIISAWHQIPSNIHYQVESHGGPIYRRQILKAYDHQVNQYSSLAHFLFDKLGESILQSRKLKHDIETSAREVAIASIQKFLDKLPAYATIGDKIDLFYINQMCADHYSLAANMQMNFVAPLHPLLSPKIFSFLLSLPDSVRRTNSVSQHIIRTLVPKLEKYPLDNSGFRVPYRGFNYLRYFPRFIDRLISIRRPIFEAHDMPVHTEEFARNISMLIDKDSRSYFI